jgi:D-inositol-3-phosphate glycosyltransferase
LKEDHDIEARLLIVGGDSNDPDPQATPEIGRLQRIAEEEGVSDAVTFVGRRGRQDIKNYYSAADVFVSTPWYEPFGITPVEAMACGTPVIGSDVGGIKYTVKDGETGFLVPPNDPQALATRLAQVFQSPELLKKFSECSIKRANNFFTWKIVAESIGDLYREVLREETIPSLSAGKAALAMPAGETLKNQLQSRFQGALLLGPRFLSAERRQHSLVFKRNQRADTDLWSIWKRLKVSWLWSPCKTL